MLVVVWLALIVYTHLDARRRISDPFLIACATTPRFFPYIGTAVYTILRPPEFIEDAHERELEIRASELRVRQLIEESCPNCEYPVEKNYLRCPKCQRRLKDPCPNCQKPVDPALGAVPLLRDGAAAAARPRRQRGPRRPRSERPPPREERGPPRGSPPRERLPARGTPGSRQAPPAKSSASAAATEEPAAPPERGIAPANHSKGAPP